MVFASHGRDSRMGLRILGDPCPPATSPLGEVTYQPSLFTLLQTKGVGQGISEFSSTSHFYDLPIMPSETKAFALSAFLSCH